MKDKMFQSLAFSLNPTISLVSRYHMFFEDLARLSEKSGQARQAEIYRECSEMAKQVKSSSLQFVTINQLVGHHQPQQHDGF